MTDLGVSAAPRPRLRPAGWAAVVGANVVGGIPLIIGAAFIQYWWVDLTGGVPWYSSDPDVTRRVGQVAAATFGLGFVAGNLYLSFVVSGWRAWHWLVALAAALLPAALVIAHHELTYGP